MQIQTIVAANASPMTLDGTRTYIIGRERIAIIDPGPLLDEHLDAVAAAAGGGVQASVLVTHSHPDHAEGAEALAARFGARVARPRDGDVIATDAGDLRVLATPGHTPDHVSFWWERERAVFCGDLMMGGLDTALVAKPEGDLALYLASLNALRELKPRVIFPAHGAPFEDPDSAIAEYMQHREERLNQVRSALASADSLDQVIDTVYGDTLDPRLRSYASTAIEAYVDYIREHE